MGAAQMQVELEKAVNIGISGAASSYGSAVGLYLAVVLVAWRYLRNAFQDSSLRAIYEEIPDVAFFLDVIEAVKLAREHRDLRMEFQMYYCLMHILRSTHILLQAGGLEPRDYGVGRSDPCPADCVEPPRPQH